jgi:hypothetical protein
MTGRIEKTVFISYCQKSSPATIQPNISSAQNRIRHNQGEVMTARIENTVFIGY